MSHDRPLHTWEEARVIKGGTGIPDKGDCGLLFDVNKSRIYDKYYQGGED